MGRKLEKFTLLMWKNWLLQWRHPIQTLVEILAPVLFSVLLVVIRSLVEPEVYDNPTVYEPFNIDNFSTDLSEFKIESAVIAYSPNSNIAINEIMQKAIESINQNQNFTMRIQAYESAMDMETKLIARSAMMYTLAGVQFDDNLSGATALPQQISMVIRFPSESRWMSMQNISLERRDWRTNILFPLYQIAGPREKDDQFGGRPGYYGEGFIPLQQAISRQIIAHLANAPADGLPEIMLQRYPYPGYIFDPLMTALQSFVSIIILLSFVYTCISTVKVITTEKERQLKESMKIMGLPNWLHWLAWFIKTFSFMFISVGLIVILIKVSWYPGSDHSVFTLTDPTVLFVFLLIYMCAMITFCFGISVFFSRANTAATIAGLFWFLSYFPYSFFQPNYAQLTLPQKLIQCVGVNSAMGYGMQLMLMFEGTGDGMQWRHIFNSSTPDDTFTLGHVMGMLILDTFIYLCIALYVEAVFPGDYGVPQVWYFPFTASYWCGVPRQSAVEDIHDNMEDVKDMYEPEPVNLTAGIKIQNLKKVFGKKVAVRNLALNMYEGQITVLLGHNGAGKTTTMSMLTGMYPPTSGTANVSGHDIRTDMDGVRASLGLCPQHNVLFDELTVKEHLQFFGRLKGLRGEELERDVTKYIELLQLVPKADAQAQTLSGGMKRKLSVGIALCGDSKVVMLDEPTAGMDPAARRALWDLLQTQKKGRTMLLTTHFMDEADLLGDRIAIMAGGALQCCGSSFFLKKRFGAGYYLIMDKSRDCDARKVTELLSKYVPNIVVQNNVGSELTYLLPEEKLGIFETMLQDLEQHSEGLGILSYGISLTTLEEVFMKVGADHGQEEANDRVGHEENGDVNFYTNGVNGHTKNDMDFQRHSSDSELDADSTTGLLTGPNLWFNQFQAMIMKRILSIIRSWILLIIQILIPVIFMILAVVVVRSWQTIKDLKDLELTLDPYDNPTTVINRNGTPETSKTYKLYKDNLQAMGHSYMDYGTKDMVDQLLAETEQNTADVRLRYIAGASFLSDKLIGWFNNEPYHTPPVTLNLLHNALLHETVNSSYNIKVHNYPLPFTLESRFKQLETGNNMGFQLAFNIGFSMALVSSFYIMFYVKERVSKAKHLQFVSGVQVYTFWGASFLCDLVTFLFTSLCLLITLATFQEDGFKTFEDLSRLFTCFMYFAWSMLPMMYCGSYLFSVPSTGFTRMVLLNIFTGVAAFLVVEVLAAPGLDLENVAKGLHWGFLIIPHYSLSTGVRDINTVYATHKLCTDVCEIVNPNNTQICYAGLCAISGRCCDMEERYYAWKDPGIGRNVVFSFVVGLILFAVLLLTEYRVFEKIYYRLRGETTAMPLGEEADEEDVAGEKERIRNASKAELGNYSLVMKNVTKYYRSFLAVDHLCVGVKSAECFGLLGINGAGKTSTFKMLTGDENISFGDAWVNGLSLKTNMKKVHKSIGYCPQFDALLDDLTGRETMRMFCMLRGIKSTDSVYIIKRLAEEFDFSRHLDKKIKQYSGGNKRKLSTAIALIGDPPVVYLDEPTTGMDPAAKRHLWNALCKIRDSGRCIILTSHSMEECEALCTRLAIMVNGNFKCIGSTQHLKSKFSEGYTLTIKLKRESNTVDLQPSEIEPIHSFVTEQFKDAVLREQFQELLTYYIVDKSLPWSRMFGIMESAKQRLHIEDYSLGQASLEQVFLTFTKYQRIEDV